MKLCVYITKYALINSMSSLLTCKTKMYQGLFLKFQIVIFETVPDWSKFNPRWSQLLKIEKVLNNSKSLFLSPNLLKRWSYSWALWNIYFICQSWSESQDGHHHKTFKDWNINKKPFLKHLLELKTMYVIPGER